MRAALLVFVLGVVACGSSHSAGNPDASNGNGDGNGNTDTPGGGNPTTVTVTLVDHPSNAAMYTFLAAYQDGAGAWTAAPAPSGDTYSFTINAPVWAFAWTCIVPGTTIARVELAYFAISEKTSLTETVPLECSDAKVGVSGTVANVPNQGVLIAAYAARSAAVARSSANGDGTFMLQAPSGSHDLVITAPTGTLAAFVADAAAITRGVTAPTTTATVDWGANATTTSDSVTFPANTTGASASTTLYTAGGTTVTLAQQTGTPPFSTIGLDPQQQMTGDVYAQTMSVRGNGATASVESWTTTIAAQSYTAPAALGGATSSVPSKMPYPMLMTTWNSYPNAVGYAWDARQGGGNVGSTNVRWTTILGPGYVGASPKFQMPDLSMLAGWSTMFELASGVQVLGTSAAVVSSAGATDFPPATPAAAGTTRTTVASDWTVTP